MLHIAVMVAPYLERVLTGEKWIESRLARDRRPPFGRVRPGDRIWLKRSGGPVVGEARVARVATFEELDPAGVAALLAEHRAGLALDPAWAAAHGSARFATLIWLEEVRRIPPFLVEKRDRAGWRVLGPADTAGAGRRGDGAAPG